MSLAEELDARTHEVVLTMVQAPRSLYQRRMKRAVDVVLATAIFIVVLPVLTVVAIGVALSLGRPIVFRQTRIGLNGREFILYKFRTMVADRRQREEPFQFPDRRQAHKRADDPRIKPFGRFLRRFSLDELPQLWNVLRGDMSLVGPRPQLPALVARYEEWQHARHTTRPGLTGVWQVEARSRRPMEECVALDVQYARSVSASLDFRILLRTPLAVAWRNRGC